MCSTSLFFRPSVHRILDEHYYYGANYSNGIKKLLERDVSSVDVSSVNDLNFDGLSPLLRVLRDTRHSIEVIKCLLHYGANPNCIGGGNANNHPVFLSLRHRRDIDVIRLLLDVGSRVRDVYDEEGHSALCIALRYDHSPDLIEMLLNAGCSPRKRSHHVSALECAMAYRGSTLRANICKVLIKKDASSLFLRDSTQRRSFLCHALSWDAEPGAIKVLLEAGCSIDECQEHYSAFGCAADQTGILKAGTVQVLLDAGVKVGHVWKNRQCQDTLMHKILETCNYEIDAIKMLFDCDNDVFPDGWPTSGLLHSAVRNGRCKPEIVQFLIDQGADFSGSCTPLHLAVDNCKPAVIEILLRNGCPANSTYGKRQLTALKKAIDNDRDSNVIVELLKGGARLAAAAGNISDILSKALERFESKPCSTENIKFIKTLLKYTLLENPKFDIRVLPLGRKYHYLFSNFNIECMREIKILKSTNIFQFISRHSDFKPKAKGNQLLKVPSMYTLPVYFDDICFTYGREAMEMRLRVQPIYCIRDGSNLNSGKVILNHDIARKIAALLYDNDLFSLLVALFNLGKPAYYAKERKPNSKRISEEPTKNRKHSRRFQ